MSGIQYQVYESIINKKYNIIFQFKLFYDLLNLKKNEVQPMLSGLVKKLPRISYNGQEFGDPQSSMEFLMKTFDSNLSSHLNSYEKSVARAFVRLNEQSMRWLVNYT
jgi:hypothetical protein